MSGESDRLKETVLGMEVFDRGEQFDPRDDTIVRVQARKLRSRLEEYYSREGSNNPVRIDLPKGGYAPVFTAVAVAEPEAPVAIEPTAKPRLRLLVAIAVGLAAVALAAVATLNLNSHPRYQSVAVLPFVRVGGEAADDYFGDGLTEEIIDSLARVEGLEVMARSSVFPLKGKSVDVREVGRMLNVDTVVEGSVRREGTQIRTAARMVNAKTGRQLWSANYDRSYQDAFKTQREIASAIVAALRIKMNADHDRSAKFAQSSEAYDLYLKGRYFWGKSDPRLAPRAIDYFEQAIALDPQFAQAYVGMASAIGLMTVMNVTAPTEGWPKIRGHLVKALELDETNADAHTLLGGVRAWYEFDYPGSEVEYRRGLQLAPGSAIGHQYFASFLGAMGRAPEAKAEMQHALRLDPLAVFARWGDAQLMYWRGENPQAEATLRGLIKEDPSFLPSYHLLAEVLWRDQRWKDSLVVLDEEQRVTSGLVPVGYKAYAYAKAGEVLKARGVLAGLEQTGRSRYVPPHLAALGYLALGEHGRAIQLLGEACSARSIRAPWLKVDPVYDPLRSDPRFRELLIRVNLPPE